MLEPIAEVDTFWDDPYAALASAESVHSSRREASSYSLAPPLPAGARVLCVGLNYPEHAREGRWQPPQHPTIFGRWMASLSVTGSPVCVPPDEDGLDWEGELAVVVGRELWMATPAVAKEAVFAYAAFNDLTARKAQKITSQWTLGKNVDGSGPLGDLVTVDEVGDISAGLLLQTTVNGELVQSARTSEMTFQVEGVLSMISRTMRLRPGDVLATGTPHGVGYVRQPPRLLYPGDVVEVSIERVGFVRTPVEAVREPKPGLPVR